MELYFSIRFRNTYLSLKCNFSEEKERERNTDVQLVASHRPATGDLACNPGVSPEASFCFAGQCSAR